MHKYELKDLDVTIYHEKLQNGLNVYLIPRENTDNTFATFTTKFGSYDEEFIPVGETKMMKAPLGIAHFLEHKMFEQEDGKKVFEIFNENSAECNANTSKHRTQYYFDSVSNFEKNLNFLLDYVQKPYFTDENVEKEKGIIIQELKMGKSNPYDELYNLTNYSIFVNSPLKYPIIGTEESIKSISKEDLYKCYNTFYHPSNMILVISGNIDVENTLKIIKENQNNKKFLEMKTIVRKKVVELDEVANKKYVTNMDVSKPIVSVCYKINYDKYKDMDVSDIGRYYRLYLNSKFSSTSDFNDRMIKEGIINRPIYSNALYGYTHFVLEFETETNCPEKFINEVDKELKNMIVDEKVIERKKRCLISNSIKSTDSIYALNYNVVSDLLIDGKLECDILNNIRNIDCDLMKKMIREMDLSNKTVVIINPKDAK